MHNLPEEDFIFIYFFLYLYLVGLNKCVSMTCYILSDHISGKDRQRYNCYLTVFQFHFKTSQLQYCFFSFCGLSFCLISAACPPNNVTASLNCTANEALISWLGQPTLNSYTATIVDENLGLLSCSSTTTSCSIPNLTCGKLYTVTVCYHDGICPCLPSKAIYFDSGGNIFCL